MLQNFKHRAKRRGIFETWAPLYSTPSAHIENYNQSNISVSSSEHLDFHRSLGQILLYEGY